MVGGAREADQGGKPSVRLIGQGAGLALEEARRGSGKHQDSVRKALGQCQEESRTVSGT